jgi:uncharacterized membrane protein
MKTLDLDQTQQDVLEQTLKRCLASLEHEIAHTHHAEFKKMLRERQAVLEQIARKLDVAATLPQ